MFAGDSLPAQVCHQCIQQVNSSYNFKLQCESSDIALHQYLRDLHPQSDSYQVIIISNMINTVWVLACLKQLTLFYRTEFIMLEQLLIMKSYVFWVVTLCSPERGFCFGGTLSFS